MNRADSRTLLDAVRSNAVEDLRIAAVLRTYFHENSEVLWNDALTSQGLL
jgi:hypothetical protein